MVTKTKESWQFGEATVNAVALYGEQGKRVGPLWFKILYQVFQHVKQDVWECGDPHVKIAVALKWSEANWIEWKLKIAEFYDQMANHSVKSSRQSYYKAHQNVELIKL